MFQICTLQDIPGIISKLSFTKGDEPIEISRGDVIYFENITKKRKTVIKESDGQFKGILFRYAIVR